MGLSGFAVSPHTGARLETNTHRQKKPASTDAPHTGARLETSEPHHGMPAAPGCPPHGGTT